MRARVGRSIYRLSEHLESRVLFSVDILTHHADAYNDGANLNETVLSPSNVNSSNFGKLYSTPLDGVPVGAEPLYVQNVNITAGNNQGVHSVVYAATMEDGLYALDANTGQVLWHDSFLNTSDPTNLTATAGVGAITGIDFSGGDGGVGNVVGILATPAIDLSTGEIFVSAHTREVRGTDTHFVQRLWAVSLANGNSMMAPAVVGDTIANSGISGSYTYVAGPIVNGTGNNNPADAANPVYPNTDRWLSAPGGLSGSVIAFNAIVEMQRPAVTLVNGTLYLTYASHNDYGPYYGWIIGYRESNLSLAAAFVTAPTFQTNVQSDTAYIAQGGIWMSGSNIASDGTYLYLVTGNGNFNGDPANFDSNGFPLDHNYSNSLLKLAVDPSSSPTHQNGNGWGLKVADFFTPSNQYELNKLDLDLGSSGVTLLPDSLLDSAGNPMLVIAGKESRIYLIDRNNLGKFNTTYPETSTAVDPRSYDRVLGEYANAGIDRGNPQFGSAAYYQGNFYVGFSASTLEFSAATFASGTVPPGTAYTPTAVHTGRPAGGHVSIQVSANGSSNALLWSIDSAGDLIASNPTLLPILYDSAQVSADFITGGVFEFTVPTVANGMVYLPNAAGQLYAYGFHTAYLDSNSAFFSAPSGLVATQAAATDAHLVWNSNSSLATEFRVDRSLDGGAWTTLAYLSNSTTNYDDTSVAPNTKYQYRVVGVSGPNLTAFSNIAVYMPQLSLAGPNVYLRQDANSAYIDVWNNSTGMGGVAESLLVSQLSSVLFTGTAANDSLTIDLSKGNPLPAGGLAFDGGTGFNTLNVIGDNGNDTVTVTSSTISLVGIFGTTLVSYTNTESMNFTGGSGVNVLNQTAAPGGGAAVSFASTTASDTINISAGSMVIPMPATGATVPVTQLGSLLIGSGAHISLGAPVGPASHAILILGALALAGQLDLAGNDLILHNGSLAFVQPQSNQGVTSSAAANDPRLLTTLGAIINNDGSGHPLYASGTTLGLFDGINPATTDLLVRETYYGDANLDGRVDGSDYSRIDNGYLAHATNWYNGNFNYDTAINGSDYTLIDNAFNRQGPGGLARLAITTAAQTIAAGTASANITAQLRDVLGNPIAAGSGGINLALSSNSLTGNFTSSGGLITSLFIAAGSGSASFQYIDSQQGNPTLTVTASGGSIVATQIETIAAPVTATQLAMTSAPISVGIGTLSAPVTVLLEDGNGNPVNAGAGGVTVSLASSSATTSFENSLNASITSLTIPAGSSGASYRFSDTRPGLPTLTNSAIGIGAAIQQETVTATLSNVAFVTPARTLVVGAGPATVSFELRDQLGYPITAGAGGVNVALSTSSSAGTFYDSNNSPVTSMAIPFGSSSASVVYRDNNVASPTLTAKVASLPPATQQQNVSALPAGTAAYYSFGTSAGLLTDTSGWGNNLKINGGTVAFTTAVPAGFTGAASFSNSGALVTSSGAFPSQLPTNASSYTIAAWIDVNNSKINGIVGWGTFGNTPNQYNSFSATGAGSLTNAFLSSGTSPISLLNTWAYVAVTYNGSMYSTYVNGQLVSAASTSGPNVAAAAFTVGVVDYGYGSVPNYGFFNGSMADLLIANTALSTAQIDALYNGT